MRRKFSGAKALHRSYGLCVSGAVGEHSVGLRRWAVKPAGGGRGEYVGISSVNLDEKSGRRKPKVSWGR